jgi:pimeloyl-ACP methyl ester carboxylesterase
MEHVVTRAGRVSYTDLGSGPPIVLLHATLHDHHDFDAIAPRLGEHYRVIALDWPGHGDSDALRPPQLATAMLFADVLEDLVTALDLPVSAFIGNSVGGYAASRLAITQPQRVGALVLANAAGFTPSNLAVRTFCRTMGRPAVARRLLPRLTPRYMKPGNELDSAITARTVARAKTAEGVATAASLWRSFAEPDYDLRSRASEHTAPTLFVWGTRDIVLPTRAGRSAQRALPTARFETLETGHVAFASDPDGFLALATPFLADVFATHSGPTRTTDG